MRSFTGRVVVAIVRMYTPIWSNCKNMHPCLGPLWKYTPLDVTIVSGNCWRWFISPPMSSSHAACWCWKPRQTNGSVCRCVYLAVSYPHLPRSSGEKQAVHSYVQCIALTGCGLSSVTVIWGAGGAKWESEALSAEHLVKCQAVHFKVFHTYQ